MTVATLWPGPYQLEGSAAFKRARAAGLSIARAMAIGVVASFKDGWLFRSSIADYIGASVRTVGRAFQQARAEGLLRTARAKPKEVPPGAKGPLPCGWSHRWLPGWGEAGKAVGVAVARAKARFLARCVAKPKPRKQHKVWTAAELDAELERLDRERKLAPPPDRPPPG